MTPEPTWDIEPDAPLSHEAIEALAALLIAADEEGDR